MVYDEFADRRYWSATEIKENAEKFDRSVREDEASYGRHGTKLLDSVEEMLSALHESAEFIAWDASRRGALVTEADIVGGVSDFYSGWFVGRIIRALKGEFK